MVPEVSFLGHVLTEGQLRPSPEKTKAITEFHTPVNIHQSRSFVGMANFFRDFVPNFSDLATPLTSLNEDNFHWGEQQQKDFESIKEKLSSEPVLALFNPSLPLTLTTDASLIGLGAMLSQTGPDGVSHPIAFWSHKLDKHQQNYSSVERECLAVVKGIEHFSVYLDGSPFSVITDCSCLQWLLNMKNPSSRLFKWSVTLSAYDFKVLHRPGKGNVVADCLSRLPIVSFIEIDHFRERQHEVESLELRKPKVINGLIHVQFRGHPRLVVPQSLVHSILEEFHEKQNHPGIEKTTQAIAQRFWWPTRKQDIAHHINSCHVCQTAKVSHESMSRPFHPIETPDKPNRIWAMDCISMGCAANSTASKHILTTADLNSRHVWAVAVKTQTAEATISALSNLIDAIGKPEAILTANGTNFTSTRFKNFLTKHQIKHLLSPPHRSQANGFCERTNRAIIAGLRTAQADHPKLRWSSLLRQVVTSINHQIHHVTRFSPRFLQFGLDGPPEINLEQARTLATERSRQDQLKRKQLSEQTSKASGFKVGDLVRYRLPENHPERASKLAIQWWAPLKIVEQIGSETFRVTQTDPKDGSIIRTFNAHSGRLAPYHPRDQALNPDLNSQPKIPEDNFTQE